MVCPHCKIAYHEDWCLVNNGAIFWDDSIATGIEYDVCPECKKLIVKLIWGPVEYEDFQMADDQIIITDEKIIYPNSNEIGLSDEVPEKYKVDFFEALSLVNQSPKASAALSRRLLQTLLTEVAHIKSTSLCEQIAQFCSIKDVPTVVAESVDAIRLVGNFAAHPIKDKNTGEIVQVEPGEAEWSLEVLRGLFDYFFIQPARLQHRKDDLNYKLKSLGKPLLK